jgi:uncharacterized membrane protein
MAKQSFTKFLRNTFLKGFFIILPIGLTVWIIAKAIQLGDSFIGEYITQVSNLNIPGLGLIVALIFIFIIGLLVTNIIGKRINKIIEALFSKVPLVKSIYKPIKDIVDNFGTDNNDNFKQVVLVNYPNEHTKSIGFVTRKSVGFKEDTYSAVFIPTTPNPTNGFLVYFKPEDMEELDIPVNEALKLVISLGSASPLQFNKKQNLTII